MRNMYLLATVALFSSNIMAEAAETNATTPPTAIHSTDSMTAGSHAMPGQKQMHMSDKVMPSHNPKCSDEALAKMPPEHRAACGK